jgi:heptosyltransferase III
MIITYDEIKKKVNTVRRTVIRTLTKNVGLAESGRNATPSIQNVNRILICRPNHRLGNLLLTTPLVQEISDTFPHAKIDLFVKGDVALSIFKNYESVDTMIRLPRKPLRDINQYVSAWLQLRNTDYDLVINVVGDSSSGRLSTKYAIAPHKIFGELYNADTHIARYPVYTVRRYLGKDGLSGDNDAVKSLNLKLDSSEIARGKNLLESLTNHNHKRTIGVFTYATGEKCYSSSWWMEFYSRLKKRFFDYNVIEILPIEKISVLSAFVPTFYSKNIRDIAALIANTSIFIGADSGMMHLANASQTPTVGLFSVTDPLAYGPYGNGSIGINTNHVDIDGCIEVVEEILTKERLGRMTQKHGPLQIH